MSTSTPCFWFLNISSKKGLFNYGQDIVMAFSPPVVGCLVKKTLAKGGGPRAPQDPPSQVLGVHKHVQKMHVLHWELWEVCWRSTAWFNSKGNSIKQKRENKRLVPNFVLGQRGNVFTGFWCCPLAAWWYMYWKESWSCRRSAKARIRFLKDSSRPHLTNFQKLINNLWT